MNKIISKELEDNLVGRLIYVDGMRDVILKEDIPKITKILVKKLTTPVVSGSATDFESDMFDLINNYCKQGLKKPELVKKMEWVLGSCKMS